MIGLEDRQSLFQDIGAAQAVGARLHLAPTAIVRRICCNAW